MIGSSRASWGLVVACSFALVAAPCWAVGAPGGDEAVPISWQRTAAELFGEGLQRSFLDLGVDEVGLHRWTATRHGWQVDCLAIPSCMMPAKPGVVVPAFLRQRMAAIQAFQAGMRRSPTRAPETGTKKVLILMGDFSDNVGSVPAQHYRDLIFSKGTYNVGKGSVYDFYKKVSYGLLDWAGDVGTGASDWYRLPQTYGYYCDGQAGGGSYPKNAQGFVDDLVAAADPFVDFGPYDTDNDGWVDRLITVHAGTGAEVGGDPDRLWSVSWGTNKATADKNSAGGSVRVGGFTLMPEDGLLGVYCHELGHSLGLPDLYDTDYSSSGIGNWCLMSGGSWNGGGDYPSSHSAWCRYNLGWINPTNVVAPLTNQILKVGDQGGAGTPDQMFRVWTKGLASPEYFLLEARNDPDLPNNGLCIWHVDENITTSNTQEWYPGKPASQHYIVALEQADGLYQLEKNINGGDANDVYPVGATKTFDASTTPSSRDYNGNDTEVQIKNITRLGNDIQFDPQTNNAGPPASMVITQQPTTTKAGAAITPAITVELRDSSNLLVTWSTAPVSIAIGANPGSATLGGTATVNAVGGIATFAGLSLNKSAAAYTLVCSSAGLPNVTSNAFDITAASVATVVFKHQPTNIVAGAMFAPTVDVTLLDSLGNVASGDSSTAVTMSLDPASNPGGATLGGTATVTAVNGVCTFTNLTVTKAGTGYKLSAKLAGAAAVLSNAFNVSPAAAKAIAVTQSPGIAHADQTLTPVPAVQIQDQYGNVVAADNTTVVTADLGNSAGGSGLPMTGTKTHTVVAGAAAFNSLQVTTLGLNYVLRFTAPGLTAATSSAFNVLAGTPTKMVITQQPSNTVAGQAIAPALTVELRDAFDHLVTWSSASVTLAIANNVGSATLSGTTTLGAQSGVATFSGISLNKAAKGYTLSFATAGLTTVVSSAFDVLPGAVTTLSFGVQPSNTTAGATFATPVELNLYDANGNFASNNSSSTVTMSLLPASNPGGATLGGTVTVTAAAGIVKFSNLFLNKAANGYKLVATLNGGGGTVTSTAFNVGPAGAAGLVVVQEPTTTIAGIAINPSPKLQVLDAFGNFVSTDNATVVTASLTSSDPADVVPPLQGTLSRTAVNGVVTFNNLAVRKVGVHWMLQFAAPSATTATSAEFTVTPGPTAAMQVLVQPTQAPTLTALTPAPQVELVDAYGNRNTNDGTTKVTFALKTNPGGGTLGGTTAATAVKGVATFDAVTLNRVAVGYGLTASATGLTAVDTALFDIVPRTPDATKSTVVVAPALIGADGTEIATVTLTLLDANGVPCQGSPASVRSIGSSPATGIVLKDAGVAASDTGLAVMKVAATAPATYTLTPVVAGVSLKTGQVTAKSVFTATLPKGLHCLGLPLYMSDARPSQVLPAGTWRLARYDNAGNKFLEYQAATDDSDPEFGFVRGHALWLRSEAPISVKALGELTPDEPFDLVLQQGWNNIANPFTKAMPWDLSKVSVLVGNSFLPLSNTSTWDTVAPYAWYFDGTANQLVFDPSLPAFATSLNSVPLMGGIWVYASKDNTTLRLIPAGGATPRSAKATSVRDWTVALLASSGNGPAARCVVGTSASLSRELKLRAAPSLTTPDCTVTVLDSSGRLAGDVRAYAGGPQTFDLAVTSAGTGAVTVSWPSLLRELAGGLTAELLDQSTGKVVLLNTASAYSYTPTRAAEDRRFRLTVQPGHVQRSTVTAMSVASGRKIGASIAVTVSGPATLTLRVKGLGGQLVKETSGQATEAGTVNLAWDGTDQHGRPVPQGTYLIEADAVSPNGAVSRAQRSVTLR